MSNFDGSSKGNPGPTSLMGVIKDHRGQIILLIIEPLGNQTSHFTKAWAAFISLSMIKRLNCNNIILFGDSLNVLTSFEVLFPLGGIFNL